MLILHDLDDMNIIIVHIQLNIVRLSTDGKFQVV